MNHGSTTLTPELPSLANQIALLDRENRTDGALQALVVDHVLSNDGNAIWIDARDNASTHALSNVAPHPRILNRVDVARSFTPYQHYAAVEHLADTTHLAEASLLVLPDVDWLYCSDEYDTQETRDLFGQTQATLQTIHRTTDTPVLLTQSTNNAPAINTLVDDRITYETTPFGPRFSSQDFETLVYYGDGYIQTTIKYWREILANRHGIQLTTDESVGVVTHGSY